MKLTIHLFLILWSGLALVWFPSFVRGAYIARDRQMTVPVNQEFSIRNDEMGKGHFGASRGGGRRMHTGIDILADMGVDVYAAKSGRVRYAKEKGGYGKMVRMVHPDGSETRYAHLSKINTQEGAWLEKGDVVGEVGKSGNAKSRVIKPHLHFEWRVLGRAIDPTTALHGVK